MPPHFDEANAVTRIHTLEEHEALSRRLADCEAALAVLSDRQAAADAALAAHAAEEIEIVEIEESPGASVEVAESEAEGAGAESEAADAGA